MIYRIEFEAGLGDILMSVYRTARYRFLNHLKCDDEAHILIISCNPHAPELFKWHPNSDRFRIRYVPAPMPVAKVRAQHCLEPYESPIPDCDCAIEFYKSPDDEITMSTAKKYVILAAGAGTSSRVIPNQIIEFILSLGREYKIPIVAVGRNYIDERTDTIRHEPLIMENCYAINLVDRLSVPGVCRLVQDSTAVICSHSAVCMLAWLERKPTFLLYGQDVWERHIQFNDGYCFGNSICGNQHQQFEYFQPDKLRLFFELICGGT